MQQSNAYIFRYVVILTVVCGVSLSLVFESLKDRQMANVALEKRKYILGTFMGSETVAEFTPEQINKNFDSRVKGVVLNFNGEVVSGKGSAEEVDVNGEYKKPLEERIYPLYLISAEGDAKKIVNYVVPVFGFGLWNTISGYLALEEDMNTVKGVVFDHAGETPGLGARITTDEIQSRYVGKKIKNENGELTSIVMVKGEQGGGEKSIARFSDNPHKVDGMSGATLTANGVNDMLRNYFKAYNNYFEKTTKAETALNN